MAAKDGLIMKDNSLAMKDGLATKGSLAMKGDGLAVQDWSLSGGRSAAVPLHPKPAAPHSSGRAGRHLSRLGI